jgi:hypothetical protein
MHLAYTLLDTLYSSILVQICDIDLVPLYSNLSELSTLASPLPIPASARPPFLFVRRHVGSLRASGVVAVTSSDADEEFVIEGSYGHRACAVRDTRGDVVAEVQRKEAVGYCMFRLVVHPRLGAPLPMGRQWTIGIEWGRRHEASPKLAVFFLRSEETIFFSNGCGPNRM